MNIKELCKDKFGKKENVGFPVDFFILFSETLKYDTWNIICCLLKELAINMKKILVLTTIIIITLSLFCYLPLSIAETTDSLLSITGLVKNQSSYNLTELRSIPSSTVYAALICVDFPGVVLEEGNWTGIKIKTLLETAEIQVGSVKIGFFARDGYSTDINIQTANEDNVILAYEKDGQPLDSLRLVLPGRWGYKWINQVGEIRVLDFDYLGFWESRGYTDTALISDGSQRPAGPNTNPASIPSIIVTKPTTSPPPTATPQPAETPQSTNPSIATQQPAHQQEQGNILQANSTYVIVLLILIILISTVTVLIVKRKAKR